MDKYFKLENGTKVDIIEHCKEILGQHALTDILIATDSQNTKQYSKYATAIVFRYGHRGAHYIYQITKVPKIKDLFTRLFKECELSLQTASYINDNSSYKIKAIELDFNDFKITKSTPLIAATKGWVESLGFKATCKSGEMVASKAADRECRNN